LEGVVVVGERETKQEMIGRRRETVNGDWEYLGGEMEKGRQTKDKEDLMDIDEY
jgi:hypothetical protein